MNKLSHIPLLLIATLATLFTTMACKSRTELPTEETDSIGIDTTQSSLNGDTLQDEVEVIPTKKADELFDDFAFAFMKNRYFQKQRIDFPLSFYDNGETKQITQEEWQFDRMYSQYEIYTLIFDNTKAEKAAKDTTLRDVTVEELNLDTRHTRSYDFKRKNGEWRLTALSEKAMGESANRDFYDFYHRFSTDREYQRNHISNPLEFCTFDDDTFEMIEGIIAPEQFYDFAPELPTSKITNILYGQTFRNSNTRILSLRTLSGGMECTMVFKKQNGEWTLSRLEN